MNWSLLYLNCIFLITTRFAFAFKRRIVFESAFELSARGCVGVVVVVECCCFLLLIIIDEGSGDAPDRFDSLKPSLSEAIFKLLLQNDYVPGALFCCWDCFRTTLTHFGDSIIWMLKVRIDEKSIFVDPSHTFCLSTYDASEGFRLFSNNTHTLCACLKICESMQNRFS